MLSPSDFNNAVPQFTNGNYASNPINPQYIAEPDAVSYNRGTEPLQTLPAQWWNWFLNKFTGRFNKVNVYVKNIFNELAQVLSIFNITPDGTEATPTTSQLKTVFETCYPQYVKTAACLVGTETTVNGHPLSSNVTVTRSDLGLGTSATLNTGTAVGCIPTVGTALGTTNKNILVTDSTGKLKPSGITVGTAAGCDATFFAKKTELNALYGNTVGTPLGTAAVGTCTTFARSDHVHPISCTIVGDGVSITVECNNEMNVRLSGGNAMWFNYRGNTSLVCIGNGSGTSALGSIAAANFCGNLCGLSQCAYYIFHDSFSGDANRNVMIANESGANIYGCIGTSQNCPLTFNPATGVLSAFCFNGTALQAGKSYCVGDFTQPNTNIYLGYANTGLSCDQISHLAAFSTNYSNGQIVIKDASKEVIQSWLGLGTAAYRNEGDLCVACAAYACTADCACHASCAIKAGSYFCDSDLYFCTYGVCACSCCTYGKGCGFICNNNNSPVMFMMPVPARMYTDGMTVCGYGEVCWYEKINGPKPFSLVQLEGKMCLPISWVTCDNYNPGNSCTNIPYRLLGYI